jgi:ribose transport system ATP-binding protein
MCAAIVEMQGICKEFNHIPVLENVNFELREGEIHSLLGENGAGKSTLMKILRGIYQPEDGQICINGSIIRMHSPNESRANGIAMVFQEFSLIPSLTVAQNIYLTRESRNRLGLLDDRQDELSARALFEQMEVDIDPHVPVSSLSTGFRQLTEIAAALSQDARILILDEPTASLTHTETLALFKLMRKLKERGISMIYISHRMEEIFQITDRITVLRDGRNIITDSINNLTIAQEIEHILGHKAADNALPEKNVRKEEKDVLLEVDKLSCPGGVNDVSFKLFAGEVLGLAGLMGSGRTELVQAIFGINPIKSGEIHVKGMKIRVDQPETSMRHKIALIPEDRRVQGLNLGQSIKENFVLPLIKLNRLSRGGLFVDDRKGNALAESFLKKLQIRSDSIFKEVRLLSGGNQQKVVIAKWLSTDPEILLMDEPTAGVDIGTKAEILEMARKLADEGKGVIIISSELIELLQISDRILILKRGRIFKEMNRDQIQNEERLHQILQGA